ncbi:MAG: hypothetical protein H7Y11_14655 [Armatimonadetes bacterium]|nr:hypothetical protein [Anaerolineae bacterium]
MRANARLFPPLWSILVATLLGLGCAGGLVLAVVSLGGQPLPPEAPRLVVLSAAPTLLVPPATMPAPQNATLPPTIAALPSVAFVMAGPTLPPPPITPTAISLTVGGTVRVIDVGDEQLNVRDAPGVLETQVVFRSPENTLFTLVGGPTQADGLTWWQIQQTDNSRRVGWAASNYLEVVPMP